MAVRQVSKKDGTKDGRRWYFYTYIRDITGNKKRYKSKKYRTQKEAERAERDFLTKVDKREINITDMTFKDLYEEFWVEEYRIESSLHTAPRVYQNDSDKLIATLEEDAYLTYVTQIGEYIITEYISAAGERYGILLNNNFEKLAYLPNLCDVMGETLVFDYQSGNLRQSRLYSLQELVALGEVY